MQSLLGAKDCALNTQSRDTVHSILGVKQHYYYYLEQVIVQSLFGAVQSLLKVKVDSDIHIGEEILSQYHKTKNLKLVFISINFRGSICGGSCT